jgi:integrase
MGFELHADKPKGSGGVCGADSAGVGAIDQERSGGGRGYRDRADFVFPSLKMSAKVPICTSVFCADYLRPAAKKAGVVIPDGHRWGLHNLRHSLANWLVNKAKENPKTVQGILGHARIQTVFDLYTDEDLDEMIAAQEKFVNAVGIESEVVQ